MVRSFNALKKRWDDDVSVRHYHPGIVIKDAGLVLGADTILVRMGATRSGAKTLAVEADRAGAAADSALSFIWAPGSTRCRQEYRKCIGTVAAWRKGFSAYSFGFHGLAEARTHR
jgi:hypothetical protein